MAAGHVPLQVANTATSVSLSTGKNTLQGLSLKEAAGTPAAARCNVRDGNGGPILASINFIASESVNLWYGDAGLRVNTGLYLQVLAGTVEGALYVG